MVFLFNCGWQMWWKHGHILAASMNLSNLSEHLDLGMKMMQVWTELVVALHEGVVARPTQLVQDNWLQSTSNLLQFRPTMARNHNDYNIFKRSTYSETIFYVDWRSHEYIIMKT
jgi:hypothetical protein